MGQGMSYRATHEHGLFVAVQFGELDIVESILMDDPSLIRETTAYDRRSLLHLAAANGQIEILSMLLDRNLSANSLNRHKRVR